jgi:hypothetical protein
MFFEFFEQIFTSLIQHSYWQRGVYFCTTNYQKLISENSDYCTLILVNKISEVISKN